MVGPIAPNGAFMIAAISMPVIALVVFCTAPAAAGPIVLAGVTGGVCAAQFDKCTARCRGSGVCTARCAANDRACRAGGKPVYR
jgi:hypothetical protein